MKITVVCPECGRETEVHEGQEVFICHDDTMCGFQRHMEDLYGSLSCTDGKWKMENTFSG